MENTYGRQDPNGGLMYRPRVLISQISAEIQGQTFGVVVRFWSLAGAACTGFFLIATRGL